MYDIQVEEYIKILQERERTAFFELVNELENWVLDRKIKIHDVPENVRIVRGDNLYRMASRATRGVSWDEYYGVMKLLVSDIGKSQKEYCKNLVEVLRSMINFCPFEEEEEFVIFQKQAEGLIFETLTAKL